MSRQRVDFVDGALLFTLTSSVSRLDARDIGLIDYCQMEDAAHQGDEEFHIVHSGQRFWLIGPFVDGALAAIKALRESRPSIPTRRVVVHALPRRLRAPGVLGLRLFPVPGLGEFPLAALPPFSEMESST